MTQNKKNFKFVICGTDTDVGKTLVSAFFVRGLNAYYWKPIQSGSEDSTDSKVLAEISKINKKQIIPEVYVFSNPVSPHWAAEMDNKIIQIDDLALPEVNSSLVVETAGGLMVPLTRNFLQIDQLYKWNLPVILVCRSSLGTLNHTLLSIEALQKRKINILGLIVNGEKHLDNPRTLEEFSSIPVIAELPVMNKVDTKNLDILWQELKIEQTLEKLFNPINFDE